MMAEAPRITLEQWRALQAVVEAGGYAQAASPRHALHKLGRTLTARDASRLAEIIRARAKKP